MAGRTWSFADREFKFSKPRDRRFHRLNAALNKKRSYFQTNPPATNALALLRVCVALRQFRDMPGFLADVAEVLGEGWQQEDVRKLMNRLVAGRLEHFARRGASGSTHRSTGGTFALLVDQ